MAGICFLWIYDVGNFYLYSLILIGLLFLAGGCWGDIKWRDVDCSWCCRISWLSILICFLIIAIAPAPKNLKEFNGLHKNKQIIVMIY
jgi:hypothetical protein